MAFQGKEPTGSKILTNNSSIEQMNTFNYLGTLVRGKVVPVLN
jgi:hypothetical protein